LAVIYFASLKCNRVFGTLLGMEVGLLQDALSHGYIGMFGMAKALVGYMAAWGSVKFNLEHTLPRFFLTGSLILVHSLILVASGSHCWKCRPPNRWTSRALCSSTWH
jgi:rod shape-determining protein MreD